MLCMYRYRYLYGTRTVLQLYHVPDCNDLSRANLKAAPMAAEHTALQRLLTDLNKPLQGSHPRETSETEPDGVAEPPLVRLARSSAITASAASDELDTNEALAVRQLESNMTAALERITPSDPDAALPPLHDAALAEVMAHAEALSASIRTSAQRKRVALQAHAVAADAALEEALSLAADIADLDGSSYSEDHLCALKSRLAAARLATAALPTVPLHGTYLTLSASSTAALRAMQRAVSREDGVAVLRAAAESALGILLTHRGHVHSAACDHEAGPVLEAAKEGDVPALLAALESGCSSEEMDSVRRMTFCSFGLYCPTFLLFCCCCSCRPSSAARRSGGRPATATWRRRAPSCP